MFSQLSASLLASLLVNPLPVPFPPTPAQPDKQPPPPPKVEHQANLKSNPCSQPVRQSGIASFYANYFNGRPTSSGRTFSNSSNQAAHRSLPFGTQVCVQAGGRSTVVVITDRGPFVGGRVIDLSQHSFSQLRPLSAGLINVQIRY
jgi:rare lipoprotein A